MQVSDPYAVADITHLSVSDYHAFDTITLPHSEDGQDGRESGDGAFFCVQRNGEWYDVFIRPAATCAECGRPQLEHNDVEVFVPRNAPVEPTIACTEPDCHGMHGADYHAPKPMSADDIKTFNEEMECPDCFICDKHS